MYPLISVIIPVYNGSQYILSALETVAQQTYPSVECIVIDDGSTDTTAEKATASRYPHIILNQPNRGLGAARNRAIARASGTFLAFLDVDDRWHQDKLMRQFQAHTTHDPLLFTHVTQFLCPHTPQEATKHVVVQKKPMPGYIPSSLFVSKKRWEEIGPFFEEKKLGEFLDWYLRAQEYDIPSVVLPEALVYRRIHAHNMGRQKATYSQQSYLAILRDGLQRKRGI